jgi:single-strand DNA-binding protein
MNENIINIVGTIGKEPELRYTSGGRGICSFSVATNRKWKNKQNDQWEEETTLLPGQSLVRTPLRA